MTAPDISCAQCRTNSTQDLGGAIGVRALEVDVEEKTVAVDLDETLVREERLRELLTEAATHRQPGPDAGTAARSSSVAALSAS